MAVRHYVVQTQAQKEPLAVKELRNQGFQTFFPVIQKPLVARHGRLISPPPAALFPKYLFVCLDLEADSRWRSINGTRGVVRLMCMDAQPSPVPVKAMERLLAAGEVLVPDTAALPFNLGDPVEFANGPMQGHRGLVQLCTADRVTVLLSLLGRRVPVSVAPAALTYSG